MTASSPSATPTDPAQTPSLLTLLAFPAFILGVAAARQLVASCEQRAAPAAMGAHSAASKLLLSNLAPTSMMTGNVTQLVIDTVDRLRGAAEAAKARCARFFWPVLAFALGCAAAALAYRAFGFVALAAPNAILCWHLWLNGPEAA